MVYKGVWWVEIALTHTFTNTNSNLKTIQTKPHRIYLYSTFKLKEERSKFSISYSRWAGFKSVWRSEIWYPICSCNLPHNHNTEQSQASQINQNIKAAWISSVNTQQQPLPLRRYRSNHLYLQKLHINIAFMHHTTQQDYYMASIHTNTTDWPKLINAWTQQVTCEWWQ